MLVYLYFGQQTPRGLSYSRLPDQTEVVTHLPYTSYTNTSYTPAESTDHPRITSSTPTSAADPASYYRTSSSADRHRVSSADDIHTRGAMIWPVNGSVLPAAAAGVTPPPPPAADMEDSEEESVSIDSVGGQTGIAQTKLDGGGDKLMMSDDDDMWDSVLQESGMVSYTTVYYNRV